MAVWNIYVTLKLLNQHSITWRKMAQMKAIPLYVLDLVVKLGRTSYMNSWTISKTKPNIIFS